MGTILSFQYHFGYGARRQKYYSLNNNNSVNTNIAISALLLDLAKSEIYIERSTHCCCFVICEFPVGVVYIISLDIGLRRNNQQIDFSVIKYCTPQIYTINIGNESLVYQLQGKQQTIRY